MDQLQLFVLDQRDRFKIALDPKLGDQLVLLMTEAIETVYLARKRLSNEFFPLKDQG